VVVGGRVAWTGATGELRARPGPYLLRTSDDDRAMSCATAGATVTRLPDGGVAVRELVRESLPLEQAFLELAA